MDRLGNERVRRRSEWLCDACGTKNWLAKSECRRCSEERKKEAFIVWGSEALNAGFQPQPLASRPPLPQPKPMPRPKAKANGEPSGARLTLDDAVAAVAAAKKAGMPESVVTALEDEVHRRKEAKQSERSIGSRIDAAKTKVLKCEQSLERLEKKEQELAEKRIIMEAEYEAAKAVLLEVRIEAIEASDE